MIDDHHHMKSAIALARRGLGRCAPNPSVGCVIVKDGHVIARAVTAPGGRPHAEMQALMQAGGQAKGADVYVTLEPCAHVGETPSCAEELVKAGVKRVYIAVQDPDPRTNGQGIEKLRAGGVEVTADFLKDEAMETLRGFLLSKTQARPEITLKSACTIDGKVALSNGASKWITGAQARRFAHLERAMHDATVCGIGTVLIDDPSLTTRLAGVKSGAPRIVFDTDLRLPTDSKVLSNIDAQPLWIVCGEKADDTIARKLEEKGVIILKENDLPTALSKIASRGVMRLLVEGGPTLLSSFLRSGFWDRWLVFRAGAEIGTDGAGMTGPAHLTDMADLQRLKRTDIRVLGEDLLEIYEKPA